MRKVLFPLLSLLVIGWLAGCQGFLEDYNYAPIGTDSAAGPFGSP